MHFAAFTTEDVTAFLSKPLFHTEAKYSKAVEAMNAEAVKAMNAEAVKAMNAEAKAVETTNAEAADRIITERQMLLQPPTAPRLKLYLLLRLLLLPLPLPQILPTVISS